MKKLLLTSLAIFLMSFFNFCNAQGAFRWSLNNSTCCEWTLNVYDGPNLQSTITLPRFTTTTLSSCIFITGATILEFVNPVSACTPFTVSASSSSTTPGLTSCSCWLPGVGCLPSNITETIDVAVSGSTCTPGAYDYAITITP